MKAVGL